MIEKDYFLRLIQEFCEAMCEIVTHAKEKDRQQTLFCIENSYRNFFKNDPDIFYDNDIQTITNSLPTEIKKEELYEMLSELMYLDAQQRPDCPMRLDLLQKSLWFATTAESISGTYLAQRVKRVNDINRLIAESRCQ